MHFGENQLSPGSIGISPLPTGHPPVLQHWWVRASTRSYPRFTLPMGSSPGFGSYPGNALSLARFRLAFAPAPRLLLRFRCRLTSSSSRPNARGRCQHTLAGSFYKRHAVRRLADANADQRIPPTACQCRGSEALSSPSRGAFHLSLTVLVHYRWPGVCAPWRVVPPASHRVSRAPWYSGTCPNSPIPGVRYGTLTRSGGPSQTLRVPGIPLL
jgi:hypothetical protein